MKTYQILAPAGSQQSLICAVQNGADAVYLGLNKFNARMKADNFTSDNLSYWVNYCHLYGVKVYVTLNTSLKQHEFEDAVQMLQQIYHSNADGVILTDLALIKYASTFAGKWEVVASTQLNVHDVYGAQFLADLGATTVVLARETPIETIRQINKVVNVKIESFLHGAMCVCQSGQCLLSSFVGGNSGNRGLCAQPCRKYYTSYLQGKKAKSGYLLSPKDMCGLTTAKSLLDAGVTTFKIEGRNRRPAYSGEASSVYSEVFANNFQFDETHLSRLKRIYNRGDYLSNQYLSGGNENIIFPAVQGHLGEYAGKVKNGCLNCIFAVEKGDSFKVLRNGLEIGSATTMDSGRVVKLSSTTKLQNGDSCHLTSDLSQIKRVEEAQKRLPVALCFVAKQGEKAQLVANCNGVQVVAYSQENCQIATNLPTNTQEIVQQLSKTGNTCYTITDIVIKNEGCFLPKSMLNALRRDALEALSTQIVNTYNLALSRGSLPAYKVATSSFDAEQNSFFVTVSTPHQLSIAQQSNVVAAVVDVDEITKQSLDQFAQLATIPCYVDLPPFANLDYVKTILPKGFGIVANNVGAIQFAIQNNLNYVSGLGLNVYNVPNINLLMQTAQAFFYSNELTLHETSQISHKNGYKYVYGDVKLMHLVHCPNKVNTNQTCQNCKYSTITYVDELNNFFYLRRRKCGGCTFELINAKKLSSGTVNLRPFNYLVQFDGMSKQALESNSAFFTTNTENYTKGRLFNKVN